MIFEGEEIERLPDYGEVVDTEEVLKKISQMLERYRLAFEPDYTHGNKMRLDNAEDFLLEVRKIAKDMGN